MATNRVAIDSISKAFTESIANTKNDAFQRFHYPQNFTDIKKHIVQIQFIDGDTFTYNPDYLSQTLSKIYLLPKKPLYIIIDNQTLIYDREVLKKFITNHITENQLIDQLTNSKQQS